MTESEKLECYIRGWYVCVVPPVYTGTWEQVDWIKWIDSNGIWKKDGL